MTARSLRSFPILAAVGIAAAACACSALLGAYQPIELTDGGVSSSACDGGKAAAVDARGTVADAGSPVADAGSSGPPVVATLATSGGIPNDMATDGTDVFWTGFVGAVGAGILRVSVNGGAITVLATIPPGTSEEAIPYAVALDATNVYWTVSYDFSTDGGFQTNILRTPRGGGPTTVLLSGQQVETGLAVDETSIYWGNGGPAGESAVMKMPLNGGAATTLASSVTFVGSQTIAVDSTSVYWATQDAIMKVPLACGMPMRLAPAEAVEIAVAATGVYWTDPGSLLTVGLGGGAVKTIASYGFAGWGGPVAVDATNVYWSYFDPSCSGSSCAVIASTPLAGGPPTPLVTGLSGLPIVLAVDATSVYWAKQGLYCGGQECTAVQKITPK